MYIKGLQPLYYLRNKACLEKYATAQHSTPLDSYALNLAAPPIFDILPWVGIPFNR
jgi:hypothetical protein